MNDNSSRSYIAFISYRHTELDKKAAERIQKRIENYHVPKEYSQKATGSRLGICFRDETELPASASLSENIYEALDHSKFLIVVSTPELPRSRWCEEEIRYFLKTHDRDHVLAVLVDGEPEESFSPLLLHEFDEDGNIIADMEPLAANIKGPNHTIDFKKLPKEMIRIYAALLGCPFDALWQRERRARLRRMLAFSAAALLVLLAFVGVLLNRNAKISEQNRQLSRQVSSVLTDTGYSKLNELDIDGAIGDALQAVSSGDPEVYDHEAIHLLTEARGAYQTNELSSYGVYERSTPIRDFWVTADEKHVILLESTGTIRCLAMDSFEEEWHAAGDDPDATIYTQLADRVLCKNKRGLYALSIEDGHILWSFQHSGYYARNYFQALSPDGRVFAVFDRLAYGEEISPATGAVTGEAATGEGASAAVAGYDKVYYCVRFLNTENGEQVGRTVLTLERGEPYIPPDQTESQYQATFSEDGEVLVCAIPTKRAEEDGSITYMVTIEMIDMATYEAARVLGNDMQQIYEGFYVSPEHDRLLFSNLSYSGLLWMLSCPMPFVSVDAVTYNTIGHHFSTPGGIDQVYMDFSDVNRRKMMVWKDRVMVFSDNTMYVFDSENTTPLKSYPMSGQIVNAYWLDQEAGLFEVVCSDGWIVDYQCKDQLFDPVRGKSVNHALRRGIPVGGSLIREDEGSFLLSISEERPGQLIKSVYRSDPNGAAPSFPHLTGQNINSFQLVDGTDTGALFQQMGDGAQFITFSRSGGEELASCVFQERPASREILPLDGDRFLCQSKVFSSDGTIESYGEPFRGIYGEDISAAYPLNSVVLSDGSILSVNMTNDFGVKKRFMQEDSEDHPFYGVLPRTITIWLDGKLTKASTDLSSAIFWPDDLLDRDSLMLRMDALALTGAMLAESDSFEKAQDAKKVLEEVQKDVQSSPLLKDEESVLSQESCAIGANGLVVWYGNDLQIVEASAGDGAGEASAAGSGEASAASAGEATEAGSGEPPASSAAGSGAQVVVAESPRFSVYDVHEEKLTRIEDELAEIGITKLICGNRDPWILTVRSDGRLVLIDVSEGSFTEMSQYSEGEISAVAFTADDRLIAVLTVSGQLDVYDTKSRELIYSAASPMLQELMLEKGLKLTKLQVGRVNEETLSLSASEESASTGYCVLADVGAQLILAEIRNVFAIDVENSCVYCSAGNNQLIRYPLYSAEDLIKQPQR